MAIVYRKVMGRLRSMVRQGATAALGAASLSGLLRVADAHGAQYQVACPATVSGGAVKLVQVPKGWTANVPGPFWLHSAVPMGGPPSDMAVLEEADLTRRSGNITVKRWDLRGTFAGGKWMACNYGHTNEIFLSRRLDDRTTACTVARKEHRSGKVDMDIRCER